MLDGKTQRSLMTLINQALSQTDDPTFAAYYTPVIDESGILSWTINSGLENPDPVSIAGPPGKSIQSVQVFLARSSSPTNPPASFSASEIPQITGTYRYMWCYLHFEFSDGTSTDTRKFVIGAQGDIGQQGLPGVSPTVTASKTDGETTIVVSDVNGAVTTSILDGEKGKDGKEITAITAYFYRSSSSSMPSASASFSTTMPTLTSTYRYLWCYYKFTFSDGTTLSTTKHIAGVYGNTGNTGSPGQKGLGCFAFQKLEGTSAGGEFVFNAPDGANEIMFLINGSGTKTFSVLPVSAGRTEGSSISITTAGRYPYLIKLTRFSGLNTDAPFPSGWLLETPDTYDWFYTDTNATLAQIKFPNFPPYTHIEMFSR